MAYHVKLKHIKEAMRNALGKHVFNSQKFVIFWDSLLDSEREEIKANFKVCQKEKMYDQFVNSVLSKIEEVADRPPIDTTPIPKPIKFIPKTVLRKPKA